MLNTVKILFVFLLFVNLSFSQISLSKNTTIKEALSQIENQTDYKFSYSESAIKIESKLNKDFSNASIQLFLDYLYVYKNIKHLINDKQITLFPAKNSTVKFISGYVKDKETNEVLIFATVWDEISKKGTTTNEYGYYNLASTNDSINLIVSYIGYPKTRFNFSLENDLSLDLKLNASNELNAVEITAESELSSKEGRIELNPEDYKKAPTVGGENDPLRTLTLLPGVNTSENENYIHVRGGNIGENMIMIDGVPVYKLTHFGRLSVVNGDIINKTTFYKSNFPSRYSGRTSSIIDFRVNNGNTKQLQAIGNVGFETAKLALDGPIGKKLTFLVSGRRNYGSIFKDFALNNNTTHSNFYDLYGKLNFTHRKGNIAISSFFDSDNNYDATNGTIYNNNRIIYDNKSFSGFISAQSNLQLTNKLFWNSQITYYDYAIRNDYLLDDSLINTKNSHIQDLIFNHYFALSTEKHYYNFGVNYTYHNMFSIYENYSSQYREKVDIHESNLFFEDVFMLNKKWKVRAGSSISLYSFGKQLFWDFLPKFSSEYQINSFSKASTSFSRLAQNIHLLPVSDYTEENIFKPEIWQSSSLDFNPLQSNTFSMSYKNEFIKKMPFSFELYYKLATSEKHISSSNTDSLFSGIESNFYDGKGYNYGLEFLIEKKGKLSGWINYTLAWSKKKFNERFNGIAYPSSYDRRHLINIVGNYDVTKKINVNGSWSFKSGNALYIQVYDEQVLNIYLSNSKNESQFKGFYPVNKEDLFEGKFYNFPSYNEFNFQISFSKKKKWGKRVWQIGCKNVFNSKELSVPAGVIPLIGIKDEQLGLFFKSQENVLFKEIYPYITYRFILK